MKHDQALFAVRHAYGSTVQEKVTQFLPLVRKLAWYYEGHGSATVDVWCAISAAIRSFSPKICQPPWRGALRQFIATSAWQRSGPMSRWTSPE